MHNKTLQTVTEESVLVVSLFKWIFLATIIGAVVGSATSFFLYLLDVSIAKVSLFKYFYFGLPFILAMCVYISSRLSPDSQGHGTEKVIKAVHRYKSNVRLRIVPVKLVTTILTIAFGGSVGKEGPCAQIGAALSSGIAKLFKFSVEDRKKLVICGISAGFASVFGTPIAAAIFGVEVLFMGNLLYSVLLPSLISGMVSYQISHFFGIQYHYNFIEVSSSFDLKLFFFTIIAGIFFGIICVCFIETMKFCEKVFKKIKLSPELKAFIGGMCIVLFTFFISTQYLGLGLNVIEDTLAGVPVLWYAFILKIMLTCITLSFGGSGGVLTPIFFIGATAGASFAQVFNLNPVLFASFGMASLIGGAANTPVAACVLAIEMFGPSIAPYAALAVVVSFFMTGYRSIFPSQVLSTKKTQSVILKNREEVEHFETHFDYKTRKILVSGRLIAKKFIKNNNIIKSKKITKQKQYNKH